MESIKYAFEQIVKGAKSTRTAPVTARVARLKKLRDWIHTNRLQIQQAMYADYKKPATEVDASEIAPTLLEIKHALQNIHQWVKPKKVDTPLEMIGSRSYIQYEPRGACLIISPWNYPFMLTFGPVVSALAAGNTIIIKPSELTPATAALITKAAKEIFEPETVQVVEGGVEESTYLLSLPFDHIFFTGSPSVGKIVMKAAAEHLTSVTLELGGKSPTVVMKSARIKEAAARIVAGKFLNNGQTCLAPDYILADESIVDDLIDEIKNHISKMYAPDKNPIEQSADYGRIVNAKHFARVKSLLTDAVEKGAEIVFGGNTASETNYLEPTILKNVSLQSRVMDEEIFGPVLPIVPYKNTNEAIAFINTLPKALAMYIFGGSKAEKEQFLKGTSSGAVVLNDCAVHFVQNNLPFGGVNNSGIGKSHGYYGFLAFSNEKPVMRQKHGFTSVGLFFPPYTPFVKKAMDWFLKFI